METIDPARLVAEAESLGARQVEVLVIRGSYRYVEARNNKLDRIAHDTVTTVGVRVLVNGSVGSAGGEVSRPEDLQSLIEKAVSIARAGKGDWPGFNPDIGKGPETQVYDSETASMSVEEVADTLRNLLKEAARGDYVRVASAAAEAEEITVAYANSYGGPIEESYTTFSYGLELSAKTPEGEGTYTDYIVKSKYDYEEARRLTALAVKRVLDAVKAKPLETRRTTLILDAAEAASILDIMLSPAVSAEQVQEGRSPLAGRLGSLIFNERISVYDDPAIPWEPGSRSFDSEGHPTVRKAIVEGGVLKTYLYDYYTAVRDGVESTGNASRRRPWTKPTPQPTNLVLKVRDAKATVEGLLAGVDEGVLVVSTIGSWMSNPVSGNVNATVTLGYIVRAGSLEAPVKGVTWGDDFYSALRERLAGAGGFECRSGVCTHALAIADTTLAGR